MARRNASADTGEIVAAEDAWSLDDAKAIDFVPKTFEEIEEFFANEGGLITFEGSAYALIEKSKLVDVPFAIVDTRIWESKKFGREVCSIMLLTKNALDHNGEARHHFVINDGSTGIFEQVKAAIQAKNRTGGFMCPNGLRKSDYTYTQHDDFGNEPDKEVEATTYYIG